MLPGLVDIYERLERIEKLLDLNAIDDTNLEKRVTALEKKRNGKVNSIRGN